MASVLKKGGFTSTQSERYFQLIRDSSWIILTTHGRFSVPCTCAVSKKSSHSWSWCPCCLLSLAAFRISAAFYCLLSGGSLWCASEVSLWILQRFAEFLGVVAIFFKAFAKDLAITFEDLGDSIYTCTRRRFSWALEAVLAFFFLLYLESVYFIYS